MSVLAENQQAQQAHFFLTIPLDTAASEDVHLMEKVRELFCPGHIPLKVPNVDFEFDVCVGRTQFQTKT